MIRTAITGIGDPFILREGSVYYMYATSAPDGFRYFRSENLTDWEEGGYCYRNSPWGENCFWAPEVYKRGDRYYMIYTARWKKNHSLRIGIAVADSPEGEFRDLKDGPLFDFGYATIDATLFSDDDGREYLYFVRDCSENIIDGVHTSVIYCAEIAKDYSRLLSEPVPVSAPDVPWETSLSNEWRWNEGPALLKRNGRYYLNYSVNCFDSREYSVGCAESDSPLGGFVKYAHNPILKYREGDFSGPGHNSFFQDESGRLFTAFHIHTDYDKPSGNRRACIAEVAFDDNGTMSIVLDGGEDAWNARSE